MIGDLVKIKGLKGKQNKKKWAKNIDVSGLLDHIQAKNNEQMRIKNQAPLIVEDDLDNKRRPLDPNRFKSKGQPLPKTKYSNKLVKHSIFDEPADDAWVKNAQSQSIRSLYKIPQVPAVIIPKTGHSYNPDQKAVQQILDAVIDYEGPKQKKTKPIRKQIFKPQQVRHRNKNVRAQQLQMRQTKMKNQLNFALHSHKKIAKEIEQKKEEIQQKLNQKRKKIQQWQKQKKIGKVRFGKKLGKKQYKFRQSIPQKQQIGKKLSHVSSSDKLMKDHFDSIFRRGILQPRNIKVHSNRTKRIKSQSKFRDQ